MHTNRHQFTTVNLPVKCPSLYSFQVTLRSDPDTPIHKFHQQAQVGVPVRDAHVAALNHIVPVISVPVFGIYKVAQSGGVEQLINCDYRQPRQER